MVKTTKVVFPKKIINHYINTLKQQIRVDGVLLFGSFAWGKPDKHSDIDLVIVSPDFAKIRNPIQWLSRMRDEKTHQVAMDVVGYTPQEFANIENQSYIMAKAKKQGRWLFQRISATGV